MFLDTANSQEIERYLGLDWITGITTNPTLIKRETATNRLDTLKDILDKLDSHRLFVQITGETQQELLQDVKKVLSLEDDRVILKIAADEAGFQTIQTVKKNFPNTKILATAIFSVEQAYIAGLAGCDWVAPYVNRMENQGINPFDVISKISCLYKNQNLDTKILGASFKTTTQVINTLLVGADDITVPVDIIELMIQNKLASDSIKVFNYHGAEKE